MNRKQFLGKIVGGGLTSLFLPDMLANVSGEESWNPAANESLLRIALVGKGKMGSSDTRTALQVPGTKLVAVCDLYDARLQAAKKEWGDDIFITKDYKEILSKEEVDVVIVGTPDHWHQPICIDALNSGKHVYCEKPVIHKLSEAKDLVKAQQLSGRCFQTGSQGMSSVGNRKAKQLLEKGAIGRIHLVEGAFTSAPGALNSFKAIADASETTIWWRQFLGNAKIIPFDAQRFFCWRNWRDYSTGLGGDLFVHVLASLHYITGADGPEKVYATGGIDYYTDGSRDMPDILLGCLDYPDKNGKGAFKVSLSANLADGVSKKWGSTNFRIIGEAGTMDVEWDKVTLTMHKDVQASMFNGWQPVGATIDAPEQVESKKLVFYEKDYHHCHYDHFYNFFSGIRNGTPIDGNVLFGVRSAAPALLCYESYLRKTSLFWNTDELKIQKKKS
ncbi:MAG: Gfo/Idh/MocA family oxidoreductase [Bacteroidales bacterium]|jgi:predicted dehydrogenase|nr:Gfo/Idh/MocA family oxidoreductase [Bacteroidales bacterium]